MNQFVRIYALTLFKQSMKCQNIKICNILSGIRLTKGHFFVKIKLKNLLSKIIGLLEKTRHF